jgi:hypothetical protein
VPAVNQVTGVVRAIEYQGTYVKATLGARAAGPDFVVYVDEDVYFDDPIGIGVKATGWWDIGQAHLLSND